MRRRSREIIKSIADAASRCHLQTVNSPLIELPFLKVAYPFTPKGPNLFIFSRTDFGRPLSSDRKATITVYKSEWNW